MVKITSSALLSAFRPITLPVTSPVRLPVTLPVTLPVNVVPVILPDIFKSTAFPFLTNSAPFPAPASYSSWKTTHFELGFGCKKIFPLTWSIYIMDEVPALPNWRLLPLGVFIVPMVLPPPGFPTTRLADLIFTSLPLISTFPSVRLGSSSAVPCLAAPPDNIRSPPFPPVDEFDEPEAPAFWAVIIKFSPLGVALISGLSSILILNGWNWLLAPRVKDVPSICVVLFVKGFIRIFPSTYNPMLLDADVLLDWIVLNKRFWLPFDLKIALSVPFPTTRFFASILTVSPVEVISPVNTAGVYIPL